MEEKCEYENPTEGCCPCEYFARYRYFKGGFHYHDYCVLGRKGMHYGWWDEGGDDDGKEQVEAPVTVKDMEFIAKHRILRGYYPVDTEFTPSFSINRRFDVIGIDRKKRQSRIVEIKSSRKDFVSDKKWREYLPWCNYFTFLTPIGVINPEELPPKIGLVEAFRFPNNRLSYQVVKRSYILRSQLSDMQYISILEGMCNSLSWKLLNYENEEDR